MGSAKRIIKKSAEGDTVMQHFTLQAPHYLLFPKYLLCYMIERR